MVTHSLEIQQICYLCILLFMRKRILLCASTHNRMYFTDCVEKVYLSLDTRTILMMSNDIRTARATSCQRTMYTLQWPIIHRNI